MYHISIESLRSEFQRSFIQNKISTAALTKAYVDFQKEKLAIFDEMYIAWAFFDYEIPGHFFANKSFYDKFDLKEKEVNKDGFLAFAKRIHFLDFNRWSYYSSYLMTSTIELYRKKPKVRESRFYYRYQLKHEKLIWILQINKRIPFNDAWVEIHFFHICSDFDHDAPRDCTIYHDYKIQNTLTFNDTINGSLNFSEKTNEVLLLHLKGYSVKESANELHRSEATIRHHRKIYFKFFGTNNIQKIATLFKNKQH
jgi:DNA-binding CsgD family transcriptional regulator